MQHTFVAIANISVLVWATRALLTSSDILAIPLVSIVASLSCIWYRGSKGGGPIITGALGGFAGAAVLTVSFFVSHGIGYFFYRGGNDYFEDGAFTELVIFPPFALLVWGGFGALTGLLCGAAIWAIKQSRHPSEH